MKIYAQPNYTSMTWQREIYFAAFFSSAGGLVMATFGTAFFFVTSYSQFVQQA